MTPDEFLEFADLLPDPCLLVSATGMVLAANSKVQERLGINPREMQGKALADLVVSSPEALHDYLRLCSRTRDVVVGSLHFLDRATPWPCEGALLRPRSAQQDPLILVRLVSKEVAVSRFVALNEQLEELAREIEQRERVEQALRISENRKSAILETALDAIITIDYEGRILEFNSAAEKMFGYSAHEAIGEMMAELIIPPRLRENHHQGWDRYLSTGEGPIVGQRVELMALRADGMEFPVELAVSCLSMGGRPLFTGYVRDIAEQMRNKAALGEQLRLAAFGRDIGLALSHARTTRQMLQECAELLVNHLDGAFARIWSLNEDEGLLHLEASAGLYTHLDGPHSTIPVGQYKIGLIAQEQKPHLTNAVIGDSRVHDQEWAIQEGMVGFAGYPLIVDNRTVGVMAMFARHALSESTLVAMASVGNGIALGMERKRIEIELRKQTEALRFGDRRKDEFLAMLAHELRNPLAPIRSGLDLLMLEGSQNETIDLMREQVHHLVRLVDDLLDVSRILRGKVELRREAVQLATVVKRAVEMSRPLINVRKHRLTVELPADPLWFDADPVRMAQIIANLLNNAAKYTPNGGCLQLAVECSANQATLIVRDNGIGIDADFLPRVFVLFEQARRLPNREEGGLGIGLTLVRSLVEMHGGTISVSSEGLGKGSEFRVQMPILEQIPVKPAPEDLAITITLPRRILIVDDNQAAVKMLGLLLSKLGGHDIMVAHDGLSALALAQQLRPQIMLLDIGLPGMDGYEVARRLRQQPDFEKLLLVALTGYGQEEDRRKAREVGFDEHLIKPPAMEEIQSLLVHPKLSGQPVTPRHGSDFTTEDLECLGEPARTVSAHDPADLALRVRQLEEIDQKKNEFLRHLSHEVGNLVIPIQLISRLLQRTDKDPSVVEQVGALLGEHFPSMMKLVEQMRRVVRIVVGRFNPRKKLIDLGEVIDGALSKVQALLDERGHQCEVCNSARQVRINVDPNLFTEALTNLLTNAAIFTSPGGHIFLSAEEVGDTILLHVRDTGIGMGQDLLPRIFDLFVRAEGGPDFVSGRLGVGLTLVRKVVEAHGGTVEVRSPGLGEGSEFLLRLQGMSK